MSIYKRITGLCEEGLKLNFDYFNKWFWGKCSLHYLNKNKTLLKMKNGYNIKQQYTRNFIRKCGYKIEEVLWDLELYACIYYWYMYVYILKSIITMFTCLPALQHSCTCNGRTDIQISFEHVHCIYNL